MLQKTPFYFLRHGQTDWNLEHRCQGQTDVPLNATGIGQAGDAKARLTDIPIATICCSPLGRARQTAEIVNEALNCRFVVIDGLQECRFGEAEGKLITHETYHKLIRSAGTTGGEIFEDFVERAIAGLNQAIVEPGPVLVVAHGGIFNALQFHVGLDYDGDIKNCVPVRFEPPTNKNNVWKMISV
ncbi:MAG: histidine phosphatase family protein [Rhodospirillaceae bacterium]|jgi:broad specificity phosphatase PhoE|nr:histidine phosphatase family protein [Rhodospirillales bacterium]MBT3906805.1 histidine phosphatase family protein [Rhodospirillaceae bacterium]MBT4701782.1 histidine phosphatase family protein [Rhodospirillaceae bacterium]MBT5035831.1 histidine phosphatase family protein [Rhodospirillaceae bacterium]MBT6221986.1 histidine phosphatase family protein [Rhodospirillaceae bacterium]